MAVAPNVAVAIGSEEREGGLEPRDMLSDMRKPRFGPVASFGRRGKFQRAYKRLSEAGPSG